MTKQEELLSYLKKIEELNPKFLAIGFENYSGTWFYYIVKNKSQSLPWWSSCIVQKNDFAFQFKNPIKNIGFAAGSNESILEDLHKIHLDFHRNISECKCSHMYTWQESN